MISGYGAFQELLIKNADSTSNRSDVNTVSKREQEVHKQTPGKLIF